LNVLFLTHRLPYAPNRGDRARAYHLLRILRPHARVTLVSLVHDAEEDAHREDLAGLTSSVHTVRVPNVRNLIRSALALPTSTPITHTMLDAPALDRVVDSVLGTAPPDVVLAYCSGMARLALGPRLRSVPMVLDMVDVDSAKWADLAAVSRVPRSFVYRRESRTLRAFERAATLHARTTMVVTDREAETLRTIAPGGHIAVVPNGVDVSGYAPAAPPADSADVVFCGVMNYAPNERAASLLAREIWPTVRRTVPAARLLLVGSQPSALVQSLAAARDGIIVTGAVPDVRPYLWSSAIAAAPLWTARGIQNKVLEAVAAGLPTVVTPNIQASLPAEVARACRVGDDASSLARAITDLLALTPAARRAVAGSADLAGLTWEHQLSAVPGIVADAAAGGRP
jgi:sugar transferase (PEP-CTERM/EpsH1 system associated)